MNLHEPLQPSKFYHIYNRGINREVLFKESRNYDFFLKLYHKHLSLYSDVYAYALLGNHFHFLVRIKDMLVGTETSMHDSGLHSPDFAVSKQFAKLFSSYTQSINKAYNRSGSLFETPFKRKIVENDNYLTRLIHYIHFNPQKHGLIEDFRNYTHSSYQSHLSLKPTHLCQKEIMEWFGGQKEFINFHNYAIDENQLSHLIIE